MPCTVSKEEQEWYEKEDNKKKYGVADLDDRITTAVACELVRLLRANGLLDQCSVMARKWIKQHDKEDRQRGKK